MCFFLLKISRKKERKYPQKKDFKSTYTVLEILHGTRVLVNIFNIFNNFFVEVSSSIFHAK